MTVTTEEAAEYAGVSPATLRGWVLKGWLEPVRRGAMPLRFHYEDVARAQREHRTGAWERRHSEAVETWVRSISAASMQR